MFVSLEELIKAFAAVEIECDFDRDRYETESEDWEQRFDDYLDNRGDYVDSDSSPKMCSFYCGYVSHPGERPECQEDYAKRVMRFIAEMKEKDNE